MCVVCRGRASKECDVPALQAISGLAVGGVAAALRHVQRGQHLLQQRQAGMLHMAATVSLFESSRTKKTDAKHVATTY